MSELKVGDWVTDDFELEEIVIGHDATDGRHLVTWSPKHRDFYYGLRQYSAMDRASDEGLALLCRMQYTGKFGELLPLEE